MASGEEVRGGGGLIPLVAEKGLSTPVCQALYPMGPSDPGKGKVLTLTIYLDEI